MERSSQLGTGKRKRSPADNLVNISIPFSYDGPDQLQDVSSSSAKDRLPLPKRPRLPEKPPLPDDEPSPVSLVSLPPGILQAVFMNLDPPSLARLTRVSHLCRKLLDSRLELPSEKREHPLHDCDRVKNNSFAMRNQDAIWQVSRRLHAPGMPQPKGQLAECELFALSFGITCQFCGAFPVPVSNSHGKVGSMIVEYSVRIVWPFKVRSCMQCLAPRLRKVRQDIIARIILPLTTVIGCRGDDV